MSEIQREIFVNVGIQETRVAVLENKHLEEFYVERNDARRLVGSFYKGKVETVLPGMGASFVELGLEKNGFLYVTDVVAEEADGDEIEDDDPSRRRHRDHDRKLPSISDVVKRGDEVLVQIVKEPFGTKGPRLTAHVSLPGHFLVLMPFASNLGISKRIEDPKERDRIRKILEEVKTPDVGFVVRTAAAGIEKVDLLREARYLLRLWANIKDRAKQAKAPSLVYEEYELLLRVARDIMLDDVAHVEIDSKDAFRKLMRFLASFSPHLRSKVRLYRGHISLFEKYGIESQIDRLYDRTVQLKSGGYLIIEQTESLVAIDVNSGRFVGKKNLEDTAVRTNTEAAIEIPRQLRLRDLGGIIIIDFIDMELSSHRQKVSRTLEATLERDKAKTKILNISSIGLVEMTRQRMRRSIEGSNYDKCPYCNGRGTIKSVTTVSSEAARKLEALLSQGHSKEVHVSLHPNVAAYFADPEKRIVQTLERRFRIKIRVIEDQELHLEDIKIEPAKQA